MPKRQILDDSQLDGGGEEEGFLKKFCVVLRFSNLQTLQNQCGRDY